MFVALVVSLVGPSVMSALGTESQPFEVCSTGASTGVSGTVTEAGSGASLSGAWVAVLRAGDFSIAGGGVADGSGDFAAEVPPGSYYLYVVDPSGAHTAGFHGAPATVTVTSGAMTDADPQMASLRGAVAGTVTETGSGAPVGGAWVIGINATTGATQRGVVANGSGQYSVGGLSPGSYRPVFVDPTGAHGSRYFPNSVDFLGATSLAVTAGASTAANVALPTQSTTPGAATLSGTVSEAGSNAALGGVFVVALRASDFRNAGGAVTNAAGQYSLNVAAGDYKLAFIDSTGGHNMEWHDNQPNTGLATATSVTAPAVTNAVLDANTGSMAGTIIDDPSGEPLGCAWVIAIGPTGAIAGGAVTAANGTYTIAGLAPGTYRATIVDPNGGRTQEYWDNSADYAGATPIAITAANSVTVDAALGYLPPTNDDFDNARTIAGAAGTIDGTNHGATKETGEPNHADNEGGKSVWYQWTAPSTGTFSFDTCGSDYDTVLAAYAGTTVNALSPLGSDDDGCGQGGGGSEISFAATTGTTYRIAVDGFDAGSGNFVLQWGPLLAPPTFLGAWGGSLGDGEFDHPYGSAVDASGNVYVADAGNNRIQKFTATGVFVTQWGTLGAGNGQFDTPWGVAVDGSGNVYVSDLWNARVQKFSSTGTYLSQFGSPGAGNGQFGRPRGVAVDPSGNVYVVDDINDRVQKFSSTGVYLTQWGASGSGDGQFDGAWGIAVDQSSGNVYVTDHSFATNTSRVQKFTATGTYVTQWTLPASIFYWADGVAIDAAGALYVTDTGNQVYKYSPTGTLLGQWATHTLSDPFSHPRGIAVDRTSGHVYVTNSDRNWVQKFTLAGANVTQWGTGPNGDGRLDSPSGLAVNQSSGDVYVADLSNNRVQRFSSTGNYLGQWGGTYGTGDGQFQWAEHVAVNSTSGDVYVTEQFAARIQRFSSTGAYLGQWGSFGSGDGQFNGGSNGIAVDTAGNVYVADRGNDRVQKFTATGTYLGQWGTTGSGAGQFQSPEAIAVDALTGNVYVAEWNRVQKFTSAGTYITQWQARSSGLAVDSAGNLFATDTFGARVRKFSPTGTPLARWGTYGSGNGQFQYPQGVAVGPSGNLYVADQGNNRIQRFAPTPGLAAQSERSWGEQAHPAPPKPETPTRSANPPDSRHDETDLLEARPALPYTLSWDN